MILEVINRLDNSEKVDSSHDSDYLRYFIRCLACVNRGVDYYSIKNTLHKYGTNLSKSTKLP